MSKKVLLASTIGAIASRLAEVCEKNGAATTLFNQGGSIIKELQNGNYRLFLVEHNFLSGEYRDIIYQIRLQR